MARREHNMLEPGKESCGQKQEKFKERNLGLDVVKSDLKSQVLWSKSALIFINITIAPILARWPRLIFIGKRFRNINQTQIHTA